VSLYDPIHSLAASFRICPWPDGRSVDGRLAPERPFPAALHDSFETLLWTVRDGQTQLGLDLGKSSIGGSSAGANLAAVVTQRVASRPELAAKIAFRIQLLVVPVTDNTATVENNPTWREFEHTAGLSVSKMLWYRSHYLPDPTTRSDPEASPLLFPSEEFAMLPPAVILVGELDVIRHEGEEYARKLSDAKVAARLEVMQGMPHSFLALDAVLDEGKRAITILCDNLGEAMR
jgi:acetyl esterase/lipase